MRSEVPNPFGTSLIDLLVGALAIVALLWVLAVPNSGYRGSGEEERTSGMVAIEQFGIPHIVSVHLEHPGRFEANFNVVFPTGSVPYMKNAKSDIFNPTIVTETQELVAPDRPDSAKRVIYEIKPAGLAKPVRVIVRLVAPDGGFFKGVHITVEQLDSVPVIARVGIMPCCDSEAPHYLRTMSMSGNGEREQLSFWHEAGFLQAVLVKGYTLNASSPANDWIENFARRLLAGADVRLRSFHVSPTRRYYPGTKALEHECSSLRTAIPVTAVTVRFEPDGDITIRPGDTNETPGAPAQSEPGYSNFAANFPTLLKRYPRVP